MALLNFSSTRMRFLLSISDDEKVSIFPSKGFLCDWNGLVPLSKRLQIDSSGNEGEEGRK